MQNEKRDGKRGWLQSIGRLPGMVKLASFVYCVLDNETSWKVRAMGVFALLYLMLPIDLIPDFLIVLFGLGAVDDIAVIYMAYNMAQAHIRPIHHQRALAFFDLDESDMDAA